jgi:hypothetical protein
MHAPHLLGRFSGEAAGAAIMDAETRAMHNKRPSVFIKDLLPSRDDRPDRAVYDALLFLAYCKILKKTYI